jgi:hypothetical protein
MRRQRTLSLLPCLPPTSFPPRLSRCSKGWLWASPSTNNKKKIKLTMREECYICDALATADEHAPPECFFPEGYRVALTTVRSCPQHNAKNSMDVEYVRNVPCGQRGTNFVAARVFETAKSSYENSQKLFNRTFAEVRAVLIDGQETGAFPIEMPRFRAYMDLAPQAHSSHLPSGHS